MDTIQLTPEQSQKMREGIQALTKPLSEGYGDKLPHPKDIPQRIRMRAAMDIAKLIQQELPKVYQTLGSMGKNHDKAGFLIRGMPVEDPLPDLPQSKYLEYSKRNGVWGDYISLGVQYILHPSFFTITPPKIRWNDVTPAQDRIENNRIVGRQPHSDGDDFIALYGMEGNTEEHTIVIDINDVLATMNEVSKDALSHPSFQRKSAWKSEESEESESLTGKKFPLIERNAEGVYRFTRQYFDHVRKDTSKNSFANIGSATPDDGTAYNEFFTACQKIATSGVPEKNVVSLQKGDFLIIDQRRSVHATAGQDKDLPRWIARTEGKVIDFHWSTRLGNMLGR